MRSWWKLLRQKTRLSSAMDEELQFHIESYADDLLKAGYSKNAALEKARREFGVVSFYKEDCRNSLGLRLADEVRADVRYGLRMLRRDRVLTLVAVLSLALGIGVNVALFSFSKAVLFDPLPVSHPEQLRLLSWEYPGKNQPVGFLWGEGAVRSDGNFGSTSFFYAAYQRLAAKPQLFNGLAAFNSVHNLPMTIDGAAEMVSAQLVSGNFFSVLGVNTALGRNLTPSDMRSDASAVAIISHKLWIRRFGGSPAILGRTLRVNTVPVTIVGVASSAFGGPQRDVSPDLMMPLAMHRKWTQHLTEIS